MKANKPCRLNLGDTVALVAPASPPQDPAYIDTVVDEIKKRGFKVKTGKVLRKRFGYLAGNDKERAADLMAMFKDKSVKAILSLRGGYGCSRILSRLDFSLIKRYPKIFIGYSDITALHCALNVKANLVSFHGPVGTSFRAKIPAYSRELLFRMLCETKAAGTLLEGLPKHELKKIVSIRSGIAHGELIGGNLSILQSLIGTPYFPSLRKKILFFEEVGEDPYRIDRMLTQLLAAGLLQQLNGIAIGVCQERKDQTQKQKSEYLQTMMDVLEERLRPLSIPIIYGLPIGHQAFNATLPIGIKASIYAGRCCDLVIEEGAVRG